MHSPPGRPASPCAHTLNPLNGTPNARETPETDRNARRLAARLRAAGHLSYLFTIKPTTGERVPFVCACCALPHIDLDAPRCGLCAVMMDGVLLGPELLAKALQPDGGGIHWAGIPLEERRNWALGHVRLVHPQGSRCELALAEVGLGDPRH